MFRGDAECASGASATLLPYRLGFRLLTIDCGACRLRPWRASDEQSLVENANSRAVWLNLRDRFPHPYTVVDARKWLSIVANESPVQHLAIEVDGEAAGGIGIELGSDVERCSAEIGYWLGQRHWGRGIMSAALVHMTDYVWEHFPTIERIFAVPYARNGASYRVLERAGYEMEGRLRRSAIKDGEVLDQFMYARVQS
jgi:[ribosomal protein S5]-alanine N-acetyltransferase